ncbi:divergent protein kinase domain 2A-like [Branchiostoma floridae x Branchiostoma belcheri]
MRTIFFRWDRVQRVVSGHKRLCVVACLSFLILFTVYNHYERNQSASRPRGAKPQGPFSSRDLMGPAKMADYDNNMAAGNAKLHHKDIGRRKEVETPATLLSDDNEIPVHPHNRVVSLVDALEYEFAYPSSNVKHFLGDFYCPACFGDSLCKDFDKKFQFPNAGRTSPLAQNGVYFGLKAANKEPIVGKLLVEAERYGKFHQFACQGKDSLLEGDSCDVNGAIVELLKQDLTVARLREFAAEMDPNEEEEYSILRCLSERFLQQAKSAYDIDKDNVLSTNESAKLLTTFLLNPEPIIFQVFHYNQGWPFPSFLGACGRMAVFEHSGSPLRYYYEDTWETRMKLTLKVLELVDKLTNNDQGWVIMPTDLGYDNIVVNSEWELYVIDVEDVVILDLASMPGDLLVEREVCNEDCFYDLTVKADEPEEDKTCVQPYKHIGATYYFLCHEILTDEAKNMSDMDYETLESPNPGGLLHDPPEDIEKDGTLASLLNECLYENTPGGRMKAVTELKALLKKWLGLDSQLTFDKDR